MHNRLHLLEVGYRIDKIIFDIFKSLLFDVVLLITKLDCFHMLIHCFIRFVLDRLNKLANVLSADNLLNSQLANIEFAIAELANITFLLLPVYLQCRPWELSLLEQTVFAVTGAAELAEKHICILFEDRDLAPIAALRLRSRLIGPSEEENRVFIIHLVLDVANLHHLAVRSESG